MDQGNAVFSHLHGKPTADAFCGTGSRFRWSGRSIKRVTEIKQNEDMADEYATFSPLWKAA